MVPRRTWQSWILAVQWLQARTTSRPCKSSRSSLEIVQLIGPSSSRTNHSRKWSSARTPALSLPPTRRQCPDRTRFAEGDVSRDPLPEADVVLLVGVVEYYRDFARSSRAPPRAAPDAGRRAHHPRRVPHGAAPGPVPARGPNLYFHPMHAVVAAGHARACASRRRSASTPSRSWCSSGVPAARRGERRRASSPSTSTSGTTAAGPPGSPRSRWKDTAAFFREHYGSDRPAGELIAPTRRILELFERRGVRGTFFILGEVATFYPELVREIAAARPRGGLPRLPPRRHRPARARTASARELAEAATGAAPRSLGGRPSATARRTCCCATS